MKTLVFAALLLCSVAAWSQPSPKDYPITVHVVSSRLITQPTGSKFTETSEKLLVFISGKKYELEGNPPLVDKRYGLIAPGDYKAKLTSDHQRGNYLTYQEYEILFSDGNKSKFTVVGENE